YIPFTNISASIGSQRSLNYEVSRSENSLPRDTRGFGVGKQIGFGWKLSEGGLASLNGDYGLSTERSLIGLDSDTSGRSFTSLLHSIFYGGTDSKYSQRVTMTSKPRILNLFDISKYLDI